MIYILIGIIPESVRSGNIMVVNRWDSGCLHTTLCLARERPDVVLWGITTSGLRKVPEPTGEAGPGSGSH